MGMKIQSPKNNVEFKSIPIYQVNVRNADNGLVKAVFSELKATCEEDKLAIIKIKNSWENSYLLDGFFEDFKDTFSSDKNFNAIELLGKAPLGERIIGLVQTQFMYANDLFGTYIFSRPDLKKQVVCRKIKNVGEVLLGSIMKMAKEKNSTHFNFRSSNDSFYYKTFDDAKIQPYVMKGRRLTEFSINSKEMQKYIEYCQNKFKIDFSKNK